jgi:hypothetical protein
MDNPTEIIEALLQNQNQLVMGLLSEAKSFSNTRYLWQLATAVVSTLLGALIATYFSGRREKNQQKSSTASTIITLISDFESACLNYWCKDFNEESSALEEALIKAKHTTLRCYIEDVDLKLGEAEKTKTLRIMSELFDIATGGDFESKSRKSSKRVISKIAMRTATIMPIFIKLSIK